MRVASLNLFLGDLYLADGEGILFDAASAVCFVVEYE